MKVFRAGSRSPPSVVDRTALRHGLRTSVVLVGKLRAILHGRLRVGALRRQSGEVVFVAGRSLRSVGAILQSAVAAVVAYARGIVVVGHAVVVSVADVVFVHAADGRVVVEIAAAPVAAFISIAAIAMAVIYAAIEADMRSPVAMAPAVMAARIAPVTRRPESADIRRQHPRARHPVIAAIGCVAPITGRPFIVVAGRRRLIVVGQRRRRIRSNVI